MVDLVYPSEPAPLYPRPSIGRPGRQPVPRGEMLPLMEPSGLVYGRATRDWCHSGSKVLHPVVHLHIVDRFGNIYLQKRAMTKDLLPGYWDTAVGGHVTYQTERDSEFVFIYGMVGHPDIAPDESEVSEGKWWSQEELDAAFGKNILTPNFESEFPQIRARLLALL